MVLTENQFTDKLINLISQEAFEYGIDTKADMLVRKQMLSYEHVTKHWLFRIYKAHCHNISILLGLLRIISRLDYKQICLLGDLMAMQALSHDDIEVQEAGIRALESWGTMNSLSMLEAQGYASGWLQKYADEVILDLRKEHNIEG